MLHLTRHAQVRMKQRGVPREFVALLLLFAKLLHCRDGFSFRLTCKQSRQIQRLFLDCAPETGTERDCPSALSTLGMEGGRG